MALWHLSHRKSDVMGANVGRSIRAFITKILCLLLIISQLSDLVICGDPDDDSLQNALEFVERRQRDLQLQENEYYGQPEDIGYGYQKNFGIFENGPARDLGSPDSDPERDADFRSALYNYVSGQTDGRAGSKRKSSFRERLNSLVARREREGSEECGSDVHCLYKQTLKDLWCKYLETRSDDTNIEDLTPEQVAEMLSAVYEKEGREEGDGYENSVYGDGGIPLRSRRNYRVFDGLRKRYPSFGEGFYGKRTPHSQRINYENPSENEFLYALKFVNPEMNREAVESLKDTGYDVLGDEKDRDVIRMLNDAVSGSRPGQAGEEEEDEDEDEGYWMRKEEPEDEMWLPGPVAYPSEDTYQDVYSSDKRAAAPRIFKQHNGIHLNNKRIPVKRSPVRSKKEATDEKVTKELKGIFEGHPSSTSTATTTGSSSSTTTTPPPPPKKETTKKPTEAVKKQNATKPEVTKHRDVKKLVRRANDYTKEEVYPGGGGGSGGGSRNSEIEKIFNVQKVDKKSIDWSEYFGYDKRSPDWLREDSLRRAEEGLFLVPKSKRFTQRERGNVGNVNFLDRSQYDAPFDTRVFNSKKKFSYNVDRNIDRMERKLGSIEERIIDDAVKYTGAHIGDGSEDLRKVKSEIVHHLEAAYSLEKMKNALEEFKNSMKSEKKFRGGEDGAKKAGTEAPRAEPQTTTARAESARTDKPETDKAKRVSTKKEIEDVYGKDSLEFLNWPTPKDNGQAGSQEDSSEECPVLDKSLNNCLRVDEITGKFSELLLPICSLQQICYMCGSEIGFSRPSACDLMYLTEAENLCRGNRACLLSARNSMLALRDLHEQDSANGGTGHLSGSCLFNPCIQKYFMNTPGAVVPLEFQD